MQIHLFVIGFVQGIGFRYFVKSNARKLKLTGWVRNTQNHQVEVLAQGLKEDLEKLVKFCEKGPFLSEVKSVRVEWEETVEKFQSFEISH